MKKDKIICYVTIVILFLFYGITDKPELDFIFLLIGVPIGYWVIWSLIPEEQS